MTTDQTPKLKPHWNRSETASGKRIEFKAAEPERKTIQSLPSNRSESAQQKALWNRSETAREPASGKRSKRNRHGRLNAIK